MAGYTDASLISTLLLSRGGLKWALSLDLTSFSERSARGTPDLDLTSQGNPEEEARRDKCSLGLAIIMYKFILEQSRLY